MFVKHPPSSTHTHKCVINIDSMLVQSHRTTRVDFNAYHISGFVLEDVVSMPQNYKA